MNVEEVLSHPLLHRMVKPSVVRATIVSAQGIIVVAILAGALLMVREALRVSSESDRATEQLQAVTAQSGSETRPTISRPAPGDFGVIASRSPFGPFVDSRPKPPPSASKSGPAVGLELAGTFVGGEEPPYAIIENKVTRVQEIYRLGDRVFDVARLDSIGADRVVVDRDGTRETLLLDANLKRGSSSSAEDVRIIDESNVSVSEREVDAALSNLPLVLTQVRAVPYFKDGKSVGLRLFAMRPGSIFERLGLRNGDILKSINGSSLGDISQAMRLFEQLKSERSLEVSMERERTERVVRYRIE